MIHFEELSFSQIAKRLSITESRVSQIHKNVIKNIKHRLD